MLSLMMVLALVQSNKWEAPPSADLAKATKEIRAAYGKSPAAEKLLKAATETDEGLTLQYALLETAVKSAVATGDLTTAFRAIEAIDKTFRVDSKKLRRSALLGAQRRAKPGMLAPVVFRAAWRHYDLKLFRDAEKLYKAAGQREAAAQVGRLSEELEVILEEAKDVNAIGFQREYTGDHRYAMGRFLCFRKGEWYEGIPHLAKGSDKTLAGLADLELELDLKDPESCMALAEAWWKGRRKARDLRSHFGARAIRWAEQARVVAKGIEKAKIELRLKALREEIRLPSINLLALADPAKGIKVPWSREKGAIVMAGPIVMLLPLGVEPPKEYDLTVRAERLAGNGSFEMGLVYDGRPFTLGLANGDAMTFPAIKSHGGHRRVGEKLSLPAKTPLTMTFRVRTFSLEVLVDGKRTAYWKADWRAPKLYDFFDVGDSRTLFFGSYAALWRITEATLTPITGRARAR